MQKHSNRPRVFVSSTISDLRDLRSALKYWLEEMGLEVCMSEYNDFERRPDDDTFESCFKAIEESDYYILLVGGRRGSPYDECTGASVTQQEFRTAAALAKEGRLDTVLFVREEVKVALEEREALAGTRVEKLITSLCSAPSPVLKDPDFVRAFIKEIEQTQIRAGGGEKQPGSMWLYRFSGFEDIVEGLRVNLNLRRSIRRQALLANLKWELEGNIARLCERLQDGSPRPCHRWLASMRRRVRLTNRVVEGSVTLSPKDANGLAGFFLMARSAGQFSAPALEEAILSGEFLVYEQVSGTLVPGPLYEAMRKLHQAISSFALISRMLGDRAQALGSLLQAVREKWPSVTMSGHDLAFLYRLYDVAFDIWQLSVALERYVLDPTADFEVPALSPVSPIEDEVLQIEAEEATRVQVEQWVRDGKL